MFKIVWKYKNVCIYKSLMDTNYIKNIYIFKKDVSTLASG